MALLAFVKLDFFFFNLTWKVKLGGNKPGAIGQPQLDLELLRLG